jgi:hypothetical protein
MGQKGLTLTVYHLAGHQPGGAGLISMAEIAELADVQRPVVTTWRRRHGGFPQPVDGGAAVPLFDARQVADWLVTSGRAQREQVEADLSMFTLAAISAGFPAADLIAMLTALICLRWLDGDEPLVNGTSQDVADLIGRAELADPADEFLLSEIRLLPGDAGWLAAAVDELVEAAWGCRGAFERIMTARNRFQAADLRAQTVAPELARLVAALSGADSRSAVSEPIAVADPATGPGDLLTAVVVLAGTDNPPQCIGAEGNSYLARLARRRLAVHEIPVSDIDISVSPELSDEAGNPDVIVTQIRYQPQEARSGEAVIDALGDVAARLGEGCTAVVLGPADVLTGALSPYSPAERARAGLLSSDVVEAVIRLPGGLVPFRPGYETAIWVLTPSRDSRWRGWTLLADLSDRELTKEVIDALADDVLTWRRGSYQPRAHTRAFCAQVRISELVGTPRPLIVKLSPSIREFGVDAAARVTRVTQLESELSSIAAYATAQLRPIRSGVVAGLSRPTAVTIGELARTGRLIVLKGTRVDPAQLDVAGQHVVLGVPELLGQCRPGDRRIDRAVLAIRHPRARLTEPGDVIATTSPRLAAIVDRDGFSVVDFPARILRIPDEETGLFTPAVLATLLTADDHGTRPARAVRSARRLEQHYVALLSPAEVRLLDMLLEHLDGQLALARQQMDALGEMRNIAAAGLTDGTLTLTGSDR